MLNAKEELKQQKESNAILIKDLREYILVTEQKLKAAKEVIRILKR